MRYVLPPWKRWVVCYRDDFTCQEDDCNYKIDKEKFNISALEVHHIHGPINNDYFNLITLCRNCHLHKAHGGDWKNPPMKYYTPIPISKSTIINALTDNEWGLRNLPQKWRYVVDVIETENNRTSERGSVK